MSEQLALIDPEPEVVTPEPEPDDGQRGGEVTPEPEVVEGEGEGEEVVVVTIGDEEPGKEDEQEKVNDMRRIREQLKKVERENKELRRQSNPEVQALGKKPALSDPDIDYDEDKLAARLADYIERERRIKDKESQVAEEQRKQDEAWQRKLAALGSHKEELKVPDYAEAESVVQEVLSDKQQAIIVKGAKNPALVFYALGKNPKKAKELAAMTDLVEYAFAVATLETQLILKKTKAAPPAPEGKIGGTGSKSGAFDSHLKKLQDEADRTKDRSKVIAYKEQLSRKKAA